VHLVTFIFAELNFKDSKPEQQDKHTSNWKARQNEMHNMYLNILQGAMGNWKYTWVKPNCQGNQ
jgi:hypothetical protein